MFSAKECRQLAREYREQADKPGLSPKMATVLRNMSHSFAGLASQHDVLIAVRDEEQRQK
jgi:hypothetical protein